MLRRTHRVGESTRHRLALWDAFKAHHYMSGELNAAAATFCARWGALPVGFAAALPQPGVSEVNKTHAESRTCFRESRLVVFPEFQGLGAGPAVSDAVARHHVVDKGVRYISRTAHPRFGAYRESSPLWKPTLSNRSVMGVVVHCESARVALREKHGVATDAEAKRLEEALVKKKGRVSFSHEYVGDDAAQAAALRAVQAKQAEGDGLDAWLGGRAPAKRSAPAPKPPAPKKPRKAAGKPLGAKSGNALTSWLGAPAATPAAKAAAKPAPAATPAATPAAPAAAPAAPAAGTPAPPAVAPWSASAPPPPPPPTGSGRGQFRAGAAPKPSSSRPAYSKKGDATAIRLKQSNPKRRGTKSHERYDKYKAATTKGEYRALGGSSADYSFDLKHKYITEL